MSVKTYSLSRDGNTNLTANFKVKEFAQKDGKEDEILIDSRLAPILQDIRAECGNKSININSGYRSAAYNKKIGGATNSQHIQGTAADIRISGVTPFDVACAAEKVLAKHGVTVGGIGQYSTFTHVDVRATNRWRCNMVTGQNVQSFGATTPPQNPPDPAGSPPFSKGGKTRSTLRNGSRGEDVATLQSLLNTNINAKLKVDGNFGNQTQMAVMAFQRSKDLKADGIVGALTWAALGL